MTSIKINYIQYQIQGRDSFVISLLRPTVLHLSSLGESSSAPCQLLSCVCLNLTFDLWKSVIVMNHMCPATSKLLWGQKKLIICSKVLGIYMNIYIYIHWYIHRWKVVLWAVVALTFLLWPCLLPWPSATHTQSQVWDLLSEDSTETSCVH